MFSEGNYAHIWELEDKGKYHEARMSTSRKNSQTGEYEQDWSSFGVILVATAHEQAKNLDTSKNVRIGRCGVSNKYDKEKKITYTNYVIFNFEDENSNSGGSNTQKPQKPKDDFMNIPASIDDDELPFC